MLIRGQEITIPDLDIIGISAIIIALGIIFGVLRWGNRFFKKANQVLDDWNGTVGDKNHPAKPGVLEHFRLIDCELAEHRSTQERIEKKVDDAIHELTPNNGTSIKDSIARMEARQADEAKERKDWAQRYETDQAHYRAEWLHVFGVVREMIQMDPEQQMAVWDRMTTMYASDTLVDHKDQEL